MPKIDNSSIEISKEEDSFLGKGGFGKVTKANYKSSIVAVKTMEVSSPKEKDAVKSELSILSTIAHPNVVMNLGYSRNKQKRVYYLVMELMSGGSLSDVLYKKGSFLPKEATRISTQIAQVTFSFQFLTFTNRE